MRIGTTTLLIVAVAASLLVGCTATRPDDALGTVIGSADGYPPHTRAFPDAWGGRVNYQSDYGFEDTVDDSDKDDGKEWVIDDDLTTWSNQLTLRADGPLGWEGSWLIGRLNYEYLYYDWDDGDDPLTFGDASFTSLDVWLMQGLAKDWAVGILPRISSSTAMGADFDDGFNWMVAAGVVHMFSDDLVVGVGVAAFRSFDEEWFVWPAIQGMWAFAEDWQFRILGPTAEFRFQQNDKLLWRFGAEINSSRWLLDEPGTVAMSDYRIPIFAGLEFGVAERFQLNARIAYDVYREITFDDEGDYELEFESDGAVVLTAGCIWYF